MKRIYSRLLIVFLNLFATVNAQEPALEWVKQLGSPGGDQANGLYIPEVSDAKTIARIKLVKN